MFPTSMELEIRDCLPQIKTPPGHTFYSWLGGSGLRSEIKLLPRPSRIPISTIGMLSSRTPSQYNIDSGDAKASDAEISPAFMNSNEDSVITEPWTPGGHTGFSWGLPEPKCLKKAAAANGLAVRIMNRKKTYRSIQMYRTALNFHAGYSYAWFNLASFLFDLGYKFKLLSPRWGDDFIEISLSCMEKALICNAEFTNASVNFAAMCLRNKKFSDSIIACEDALAVDCTKKEIHYNYAVALRLAGRREDSKHITKKYLCALNPGFSMSDFLPSRSELAQYVSQGNQIHFVCVKWGTKYGPEYVNNLANAVKRNLPSGLDFFFHCFTDDVTGIQEGVTMHCLDMFGDKYKENDGWTGWWYKIIVLFHPGLANLLLDNKGFERSQMHSNNNNKKTKPRVVYIDLDTIIVGGLEDILKYDGAFGLLSTENFSNEGRIEGGYNSSVMIFDADYGNHILDITAGIGIQNVKALVHRMDHWLEILVPEADFLQNIYPSQILEYKQDVQHETTAGILPADFDGRIINFPLTPKPHEIAHQEWVQKNWGNAL